MILPKSGCFTRRSTRTTTVLSPLSDTTVPLRTRFGISIVSSTLGLRPGAFVLQRLDARDRTAHFLDAARLLELVRRRLEAQVELLALKLGQLLLELVVGLLLEIVDHSHVTFPLRPGSRRDGRRPWS